MKESSLEPNQAPISFRNHTALLLSAALPYLQPNLRHPIELIFKLLEFTETLRLFQEFSSSGAGAFLPPPIRDKGAGFLGILNSFVADPEGLLGSLSRVSTGDGKELISMFLNLIRAKKMYEDYGDVFRSLMTPAAPESTEPRENTKPQENAAPQENVTPSVPSPSGSLPDIGSLHTLASMLNPEQLETLELLKSLFSDAEDTDSASEPS